MSKPLLTGGNGKSNDFVGTANGQVATWSTADGGQWFPGSQSSGGGGGELFYLNSAIAAASPTTNLPYTGGAGLTLADFDPAQLSTVFDATAQTRTTPTLPSDGTWTIVQGFVTDAALNLTALPAGLFEFNIWATASTGAGPSQTQMRVRVGKYDSSNALTYLAESDAVFIYDPTTPTQYFVTVVIGSNTLATTDRLYVEINATATVNGRTATFHFGAGEPSHVHTTIVVPINLADATQVTGILPVANGGTGAGTGTNVAANTVFAAPNGSAGQPSFRELVAADVAGITPYDLRGKFVGNPATGLVLDSFVADRAFDISPTNTNHKFWADEKTAGADVVITVQRTRSGSTSTIFTATSASTDTALNGYYPMAISSVANYEIAVDDLIEVVMGTTQAAFSTPVWTIYGTA